MTLQIPLSEESEARLREQAAAAGMAVERFVAETLEEKLAWTEESYLDGNSRRHSSKRKRIEKLRAWVDSHTPLPHHADDSRESIYEGRGE